MRWTLASRVLMISLCIIFVLGVLGTVTLHFMLEFYSGYFFGETYMEPGYRAFIMTFLTVGAILGLWVILEMILMLRSIPQGPFTMRNVRALNRIGMVLFVMSAMFFAKLLEYSTFLTMSCGFLFLICGFFAFTLSGLFRQAVIYKEENDLTI